MVSKVKTFAILILSFGIVCCSEPVLSAPSDPEPQNEQQWIVNSIGNDIAGMIAFAAQKNADERPDLKSLVCRTTASEDALVFHYELTDQGVTKPLSTKIELTRYIWNPGNYAPWASDLLAHFNLQSKSGIQSSSTQSFSLIKDLSNYSAELLISQNKSVSTALSANPLDPELHEEAALLCATLALRECAAYFCDVRPQLNRLVAHLAVARALRGSQEFGDAGKLAEIILCSLSGREVEAFDLMKPLTARTADDALQSWLRAVRIRSTYDFRIADAQHGSMIERLEYGRALAEELKSDALTDYLQERKETGSAIDWLRFGLRGMTSVESGHLYAEPGPDAEQAAFMHDYALTHDGAELNTQDEAVDQLNLAPTGCLVSDPQWQLQAISWPNLAAFHSRHLLDSIYQRYIFELNLWAVKDQAQENLEKAEKTFSKMKLFPVCQLDMVMENAAPTAEQKAVGERLQGITATLISQHPDWFTFELWNRVKFRLPSHAIPAPTDSWFKPRFLMGTDFDYWNRGNAKELSREQLEQLRALAPHDKGVLLDLDVLMYKHSTGDQLAEIVGAFSEYDLKIMTMIAEADKGNKVKYIARLEKLAKVQPGYYFDLGYCLQDSDPQRAAKAYAQAMKLCRDEVVKANGCTWLVNYYYDHGEKEKALAMAKEAADVYSQGGLETLAGVYEKMNRLADAERLYAQIEERYEDHNELFSFYWRHQNEKPEYKQKMEQILKTFAHGFIKFKKEDMAAAPTYGGKVYNASELAKSYGINDGCIVVAAEGYRVANVDDLVRNRNLDNRKSSVEIVIWDGKQYHTVNGSPPRKKYGFQLQEWKAK